MAINPATKEANSQRLGLWLDYYLDIDNHETFMNATASVRATGEFHSSDNAYRVTGCNNRKKLKDKIDKWIKEDGFGEHFIKKKLFELVNAKEVKHFAHEGKVTDKRRVAALNVQRQTLDMMMRMLGMYAVDNQQKSAQTVTYTPETLKTAKEMALLLSKKVLEEEEEDPLAL